MNRFLAFGYLVLFVISYAKIALVVLSPDQARNVFVFAVIFTVLFYFAFKNAHSNESVTLTFTDRKKFWDDMLDVLDNWDYRAQAHIEGRYFFALRGNFSLLKDIMVEFNSETQCTVSLPALYRKKIQKDLATYFKAPPAELRK